MPPLKTMKIPLEMLALYQFEGGGDPPQGVQRHAARPQVVAVRKDRRGVNVLQRSNQTFKSASAGSWALTIFRILFMALFKLR
jgi:hypothetical protein